MKNSKQEWLLWVLVFCLSVITAIDFLQQRFDKQSWHDKGSGVMVQVASEPAVKVVLKVQWSTNGVDWHPGTDIELQTTNLEPGIKYLKLVRIPIRTADER